MKKTTVSLLSIFLLCGLYCHAQELKPELTKAENFTVFNREFSLRKDAAKGPSVYLNSNEGPGVLWLNPEWFSTGILEFDVKGKDVMQQSFVGIAFHGSNDSTYEAIYFRPFNFNSTDEIRRSHSVQYISLPAYDWFNLRETYPGKFENPLRNATSPNEWFHVKVNVQKERITVYVNHEEYEVLAVKPLTDKTEGRLGFWVGHGSDGEFSNLTIKKD